MSAYRVRFSQRYILFQTHPGHTLYIQRNLLKDNNIIPFLVQGTGKVKLQVSHMVVGTYVFVLKVTDSRGQSSEAQVKVVVLPEENTVPVAIAGDDKVRSLRFLRLVNLFVFRALDSPCRMEIKH